MRAPAAARDRQRFCFAVVCFQNAKAFGASRSANRAALRVCSHISPHRDPAKLVSSIVTDLHAKGRKVTLRDVVVASQARGLALSNAAAENALAIAVKECLVVSLQKGRIFEPAPPKQHLSAPDEVR